MYLSEIFSQRDFGLFLGRRMQTGLYVVFLFSGAAPGSTSEIHIPIQALLRIIAEKSHLFNLRITH